MRKGLYGFLIVMIMLIFVLPVSASAEWWNDYGTMTLSKEQPQNAIFHTGMTGDSVCYFEVTEDVAQGWFRLENLNRSDSVMRAEIFDSAGKQLVLVDLEEGVGGKTESITDLKASEIYTVKIYTDCWTSNTMTIGVGIWIEDFGGNKNSFVEYIKAFYEFDDTDDFYKEDPYSETYYGDVWNTDGIYNYSDSSQPAFDYRDNGKGITITGIVESWSIFSEDEYGVLRIPETIDGKTVTEIADNAFGDLYVTELHLPKTIKKIGNDILVSEYQNLKHVYYEGTIKEYNKIDIGTNQTIDGAFVHHTEQKVKPEEFKGDDNNSIVYSGYIKKNGDLYNFSGKKIASDVVAAHVGGGTDKTFYLTKDGNFYMEWEDYGDPGTPSQYRTKLLMKNVAKYPEASQKDSYASQYVITKKGVLYRIDITTRPELKVTKTKIMKNVKDVFFDSTEDMCYDNINVFILKKDNTLWGFGNNKHYELGQGNTDDYDKPVKILSDVCRFEYDFEVRGTSNIGEGFCYAIKTDGTLWGWGDDYWGTMVLSENYPTSKPEKVMDEVVYMDADNNHISILRADGTLWMWGTKIGEDWGHTEGEHGLLLVHNSGLVKISEGVKYMDVSNAWIYYITDENDLYVFGNIIGADYEPKKILSKVKYVNTQLFGDFAIRTNGTLYDLSVIEDANKDKPQKKAKGL